MSSGPVSRWTPTSPSSFRSQWLRKPASGVARKTQPIDPAMAGTNSGISGSASAAHPIRASVRTLIHASTAPMRKASPPPRATATTALRSTSRVLALVSTPTTAGSSMPSSPMKARPTG